MQKQEESSKAKINPHLFVNKNPIEAAKAVLNHQINTFESEELRGVFPVSIDGLAIKRILLKLDYPNESQKSRGKADDARFNLQALKIFNLVKMHKYLDTEKVIDSAGRERNIYGITPKGYLFARGELNKEREEDREWQSKLSRNGVLLGFILGLIGAKIDTIYQWIEIICSIVWKKIS